MGTQQEQQQSSWCGAMPPAVGMDVHFVAEKARAMNSGLLSLCWE